MRAYYVLTQKQNVKEKYYPNPPSPPYKTLNPWGMVEGTIQMPQMDTLL